LGWVQIPLTSRIGNGSSNLRKQKEGGFCLGSNQVCLIDRSNVYVTYCATFGADIISKEGKKKRFDFWVGFKSHSLQE
jgi:hypothetical protein